MYPSIGTIIKSANVVAYSGVGGKEKEKNFMETNELHSPLCPCAPIVFELYMYNTQTKPITFDPHGSFFQDKPREWRSSEIKN